jgi:hypothetical protein
MNPDNNPGQMFSSLRARGIKCSTNITPVISTRDVTDHRPQGYKTLQDGLKEKLAGGKVLKLVLWTLIFR